MFYPPLDDMVEGLIKNGYLKSEKVIDVFRKVDRKLFVPENIGKSAYVDKPLPIGFDQTISAPHMVAIMTELLDVKSDDNILEIGCGSGYQAAILAELANNGFITSIERIPELAEKTRDNLVKSYDNISVVEGDGTVGYPVKAPYDKIIVTAASPSIPEELIGQLRSNGRLLIPVGSRWSQELLGIDAGEDGNYTENRFGGCVFVPLIGEQGW